MPVVVTGFSGWVCRRVAFPSILLVAPFLTGEMLANDTPAAGKESAEKAASLPDGNIAVQAMNDQYIKVYRTIMTPRNVADAFGRRIAQRYIAMQITVANRNRDYQWLIQDASVDLGPLVEELKKAPRTCEPNLQLLLTSLSKLEGGPVHSMVSSADLTVLRGVAEKGQSLDPRNVTLRVFTAAGVIAAGLSGVTPLGHSYSPGVAAFNGPFISAFKEVFPDYTVEQLNRLNDSAYLANTVVGKQQAKVIVIFIPQAYLLTKEQQKKYYKNPESVYGCPDLRLLTTNIDGNFIANVTGTPVVTAVNIDSSDVAKFEEDSFTISGTIVGNFFSDSTLDLVSPPSGLTRRRAAVPPIKRSGSH